MSLQTRVEKLEQFRRGGGDVLAVRVAGGFPGEFGYAEPGETDKAFVARKMAAARQEARRTGQQQVCVIPEPVLREGGLE